MEDHHPVLKSCKPLKPEFSNVQEIKIASEDFTIGRSLNNSTVIPFLAISRNHCKFKKNERDWFIEDNSLFGIFINDIKLGKGSRKVLKHNDVITLDATKEFVYKFIYDDCELTPVSKKRIKLETDTGSNLINNVKIKFEESQNYAIKHIEDKIHNTKKINSTNMLLKEQLQSDMKQKIQSLETEFASQIQNLKGEKAEVEKQKALLIEVRDAQLAALKLDMEGRIEELMEQIKKHNEIESELIMENNLLKEKMLKEREDFLLELNRESSLKKDLLDNLEAKMREQEENRLKEKKLFEDLLRQKTELLRLEKDKELHTLAEAKKQRERELLDELNNIKRNLEEQVRATKRQRSKAQEQLNNQLEEMKKAKSEDRCKMEKLTLEREAFRKRFDEAQQISEKYIEELKARVTEREVELAALASERIQKQAEQSSEVISALQNQLEKVQHQLQNVESENKKLLQNSHPRTEGESSNAINEFSEIMESELQCSICAELFVSATTLNCSHTFCRYCISMWKMKKKDCPICRTTITSECKSIVLDSFIDKMVQNLSEEMKTKRQEMLQNRKELESELENQLKTNRRRESFEYEDETSDSVDEEEEDEGEDFNFEYSDFTGYEFGEDELEFDESDSDGRSYDADDAINAGNNAAGGGRCVRCGARGHRAARCPLS